MALSLAASNPNPAPSDGELLDAYSSTIATVADRVGPAVAAVISKGRGMGSGVAISPDGLVVTNHHVIDGATSLEVAFPDGRRMSAELLGADPDTDLALLKAHGAGLPAAILGDSSDAEARPDRGGDRQPARLRFHRHGRRRLGARPFAGLAQRPADRGRDPDRRRAQSRQFRRRAGVVGGRRHRHQHRDDPRRARHLLCGRQQHGALRGQRDPAPWRRASRLARRRRRHGGAAAPRGGCGRSSTCARPWCCIRSRRTGRRRRPGCRPATSCCRSARSRPAGRTSCCGCLPHAEIGATITARILRGGRIVSLEVTPALRPPQPAKPQAAGKRTG